MVEQILRNVIEDDLARLASLERTEGNETVATADVEKCAAVTHLSVGQHSVAYGI